jgi:hypothetical protein
MTNKENTLKNLLTTLTAAVVFVVAGAGIASAQTAPASSTTVATAGTGTVVSQATPAPKPKKPLFTLHVGAQSTWNVGSSDLGRPDITCPAGVNPTSPSVNYCGGANGNYVTSTPVVHLDYGINIPIGKFSLNYAHSYINQNIGRVASGVASHPYAYQVLNDDLVDDANVGYNIGSVAMALGWHQRVRMCCGNNSNLVPAVNRTMWHDIYLQEAAGTGPTSKYFGKWATLTVQEQFFPHTSYGNPATADCGTDDVIGQYGTCVTLGTDHSFVPYEGNKWHVQFTPRVGVPIGGNNSTFQVYALWTNNIDYFLNSPTQYLYNQVDYGFVKKWPPYFTLTVTNSNLYEYESIKYPYINADTINRNKLLVILDCALPIY